MLVSVIVPCRNEERYIGPCLDSILATSWPLEQLEIIVADGRSDDRTREIVEAYQQRNPLIRLVDNPRKIVSAGLNLGIEQARGDVIMRMDAHAAYPPGYIPVLVHALQCEGADNVGSPVRTLPADGSPVAAAVAVALSHPLGVGNSTFRIGTSEPRWVDTVPFGCWKRETFRRIGLFDEELVRNQDDEFNHRLLKAGGRILLHPGAPVDYFGRRTLRQLWRMYWQYGYYKPLAVRKVGGVMTLRQLLPPLFVSGLILLGIAALFHPIAAGLWLTITAVYSGALIAASIPVATRQGIRCAAAVVPAIASLHFSYGLGYLRGIFHFTLMTGRGGARATDSVKMSR